MFCMSIPYMYRTDNGANRIQAQVSLYSSNRSSAASPLLVPLPHLPLLTRFLPVITNLLPEPHPSLYIPDHTTSFSPPCPCPSSSCLPPSSVQYFLFKHSLPYQEVQFAFLDAVASLDHNNIAVSSHTNTLLLNSV